MADRVHPSASTAAKTINYILSSFRPLVHAVKYIFVHAAPKQQSGAGTKKLSAPIGMENSVLCVVLKQTRCCLLRFFGFQLRDIICLPRKLASKADDLLTLSKVGVPGNLGEGTRIFLWIAEFSSWFWLLCLLEDGIFLEPISCCSELKNQIYRAVTVDFCNLFFVMAFKIIKQCQHVRIYPTK